MRRRKLLYGLGASGAVLVPSGLTAAAYNSFTVERETTIDVVSDSSGLLGITAGTSSLVTEGGDGEVGITIPDSSNGTGVNVDATLDIGTADSGAQNITPAFSFSNNDNTARDITVSHALKSTPTGGSEPYITFEIYDDTVSSVGTINDDGSVPLTDVAADETYDVVVSIDTNGLDASTDDLSGTLTFDLV